MIQQLLTATMELRLLRVTGSQSMERIVTMDKELGRSNKTEVVTDDATVVLRRAVKLAQGGLLVSIGPSQRQAEGNKAAQVPNIVLSPPATRATTRWQKKGMLHFWHRTLFDLF